FRSFEEKRVFDLFLSGTDLPADKRKEALQIFDRGILVEELNLPAENSWILKKFFLEIATLVLWADRKLEDEELAFLRSLCRYLNYSDEDLENSLIAVEGFVLEHWEQLARLQNKPDFQKVSEQFISRVSSLAEKNRGRILKELESSREVMNLIKKARSNELTPSEKERMRTELI